MPKKVASSERTIKRLISKYKINKAYLLQTNGKYKEWTFIVENNKVENRAISIALNRLWDSLLKFEIKILANQK